MAHHIEQTENRTITNPNENSRAAFSNEASHLQAAASRPIAKPQEPTHLDFGPISKPDAINAMRSAADSVEPSQRPKISVTDQQKYNTADVFAVAQKSPETFTSTVDAYNKNPQMMTKLDQNGVLSHDAHVIVNAESVPGETAIINSIRKNIGNTY